MFAVKNAWTPGFNRVMGQITPLVSPAPSMAPMASGGGPAVAGLLAVGAGALTIGVVGISVLFTYGIAKESKSGLVKTTGYILAGAGALVGLVEAVGVGYAVAKAVV